jgi:hypothetical protein
VWPSKLVPLPYGIICDGEEQEKQLPGNYRATRSNKPIRFTGSLYLEQIFAIPLTSSTEFGNTTMLGLKKQRGASEQQQSNT